MGVPPAQFHAWLQRCLRKFDLESKTTDSKSSTAILAEYLAKDDTVVRRWIVGDRTPNAKDTFSLGSALHACGVEIACGALALRHNNLRSLEYKFLDFLDRRGHHGEVFEYLNVTLLGEAFYVYPRSAYPEHADPSDASPGNVDPPLKDDGAGRARYRKAVNSIVALEAEFWVPFSQQSGASPFGLLGAVHHLVSESRLDPEDINDAVMALLQRWDERTRGRASQE
jgi:hypothetical protein